MNKSHLKDFIIPKFKYGIASGIATSVDYSIFFLLVLVSNPGFIPLIQAFAYACGVLANFFLRKTFVFSLNRSISVTFSMSMTFSLIGMGLSTLAIYLLTKLLFFSEHLLLTKFVITATFFIYNFYANRFAFENKGVFSSIKVEEEPEEKN